MMTAASAPPAAVLEKMEALGIEVTHVYGLTEVYGPATVCAWQEDWGALDADARARKLARQGVPYPVLEGLEVMDPDHDAPVPRDGTTIGEIMMRGHDVMKGYLKNPTATEQAFAGGWFHTGDLAVMHPDGYVEIKDRSKDIIISGGENISSIEIEGALYRHPAVLEAAVRNGGGVAWGEQAGCMFCAVARFFRPGYHNHLVGSWLPALDGIVEKLNRGAKVADIGCGHGWSTVMMAKAFPHSQFIGYDFHSGSIDAARAHASSHGVAQNARFEVGTTKDFRRPDWIS